MNTQRHPSVSFNSVPWERIVALIGKYRQRFSSSEANPAGAWGQGVDAHEPIAIPLHRLSGTSRIESDFSLCQEYAPSGAADPRVATAVNRAFRSIRCATRSFLDLCGPGQCSHNRIQRSLSFKAAT